MPRPNQHKILLDKAKKDEFSMNDLIANPLNADEIIGFHAQQAVEKAIKAVLAFRGIRYRKTHDIGALIYLARKSGIDFPQDLENCQDLTPYAVLSRYDEIELDESLNRDWSADIVRRTRQWAEGLIQQP